MPLPLFKLVALLAKQVSKPLAKILKDKAKQNETFKRTFILPSANMYHTIDINIRMRILGLGSLDKVPPLTEKASIELGGDILSEFFVFTVASGLIIIEYLRQSSNTTNKSNALSQKVQDMEDLLIDISKKFEQNQEKIAEISKLNVNQKTKIDDLHTKINKMLEKK